MTRAAQLRRCRRVLARGIDAALRAGVRAAMQRMLPDDSAARVLTMCSEAIDAMADGSLMTIDDVNRIISRIEQAEAGRVETGVCLDARVVAAVNETLILLGTTRDGFVRVPAMTPSVRGAVVVG